MKNDSRDEVRRLGAQRAPSRVEADSLAIKKTLILGLAVVGVVVAAAVIATALNLHFH